METINYDLSDNEQFEKLFDMSIHEGTIVTVDVTNNKAKVNIDIDGTGLQEYDEVEIFYHCEDNTTDAGATAFTAGDSVLVINEKGKCDPIVGNLKIIGFVGELKHCLFFKFKLTRADGELVDEALMRYITVRDSSNNLIYKSISYDAETEYWTIKELAPVAPRDPNGYWIEYLCEGSAILTQYPGRYKDADKKQVADLIQPGVYEGIIHYWEVEYSFLNTTEAYNHATCTEVGLLTQYSEYFGKFIMPPGSWYTHRATVKSSVPYRVHWQAEDGLDDSEWNIVDYFHFDVDDIYIPTSCKLGETCSTSASASSTPGVIAQAQITGGGLSVLVDYNNSFNENAYTFHAANLPAGANHDMTLKDITDSTIVTTCTGPWTPVPLLGDHIGELRSVHGIIGMIDVTPRWDY